MIGTVSLSVLCATLMDLIFPSFVYTWRDKRKAISEKKKLLRKSYHWTKGDRTI